MAQESKKFKFEYVTSQVLLRVQNEQPDGIVIHVINNSDATECIHITIFGAPSPIDSEDLDIAPGGKSGIATTIPESGGYWVRIQSMSDLILPTVSFDHFESTWVPIVRYLPNDFAVFQLEPDKKRLW